jgi:hypothetical protein
MLASPRGGATCLSSSLGEAMNEETEMELGAFFVSLAVKDPVARLISPLRATAVAPRRLPRCPSRH